MQLGGILVLQTVKKLTGSTMIPVENAYRASGLQSRLLFVIQDGTVEPLIDHRFCCDDTYKNLPQTLDLADLSVSCMFLL